MEFEIPDGLATRAVQRRGHEGAAWINGLNHDLGTFAMEHDLRIVRNLRLGQELAVSFLVQVANGPRAVLRAVEDRGDLMRQAAALELWRGRSAADLMGCDPVKRLLLIEALTPDRDLHVVPPAQGLVIACSVAKKLWTSPLLTHPFPLWRAITLEAISGGVGSPTLRAQGPAALARRRHASETRVVVHGDLHRGNILAGADDWAAIDPLPCVAPAAMDLAVLAADLIADHVGTPTAAARLLKVVDQMVIEVGCHDIDAAAVLDWMLLLRLALIVTAEQESKSPDWDIELAELISTCIDRCT